MKIMFTNNPELYTLDLPDKYSLATSLICVLSVSVAASTDVTYFIPVSFQ